MKKNEHGFGVVEILLIVVIVGILGFVGWYVWNSQKKTNTTLDNTSKSQSEPQKVTKKTTTVTSTTTKETPPSEFVNVIQDNENVIQVAPSKIAKTADQAKILQALHELCKDATHSYVTVNHIVFDGNSNFKQDGNYAEINISRCDPKSNTLADLGGSGAATYLHKNSNGVWVYDIASQMGVLCKDVDGKGYPTTIIPDCYQSDGTTTRAPK